MSNPWYLRNPLIHSNRRKTAADSEWVRSFSCAHIKPLIICRGPIRMEAMCVFEEMGITDYGILLSEKDSISYANALSPELRKHINPTRVHRVQDYTGATGEERGKRIAEIIDIASHNNYDAIFAGYGFMAEDEDMVAAMEDAGLNFIGPCSNTIREAGRKDLAKRTALATGVSVTPGVDNVTILTLLKRYPDAAQLESLIAEHRLGIVAQFEDLELLAESILNAAYSKNIDLFTLEELSTNLADQVRTLFTENPQNRIRLKAIGGGGGKGQRILNSPNMFKGTAVEQIDQAVAPVPSMLLEVLSEVKATGVGDNKNVLAEVNIETVRHEEIQVVGNGDWCITMGGRDCSVQMNEQKLLEVSVTVDELQAAIDDALAAELPDAARTLQADLDILNDLENEAARFGSAVGLDSVSTFECIVERDNHYFMEMNTRVQVEHRVTELCYALEFTNPLDSKNGFSVQSIVELMVLLAVHGSRLPCPVRKIRENASLEVRLNATDDALKPHAGGIISHWSDAVEGEIRDDQGICLRNPDTDVFMKYHLAGAYDSNIALLITTGANRGESYGKMAEILRQTNLGGENLSTNLEFHYGLVNWLIGNGVQARPATNFSQPYLTAVGQLKKLANKLNIVQAYEGLQAHYLAMDSTPAYQTSVLAIMQQKSSLLARVLHTMLAQPHYLSGWLATNRQHFSITSHGIIWKTNPIQVVANLYHYLNMDDRTSQPALYAIWDHDQQLLETALAFYATLEEKSESNEWQVVQQFIEHPDLHKYLEVSAEEVRAAHSGYQLGMDILSILPYIGHQSGFFELKVNPDLSIHIPERLTDPQVQRESQIILSPPPVAADDEIRAPSGGMFYAREAPGREPFVTPGQHFDAGDPLFIVEVMKMFNKVYATFSGTIDEVLVESDASIVKKGQVVFKVIPDEITLQDSEADKKIEIRTQTAQFLEFTQDT